MPSVTDVMSTLPVLAGRTGRADEDFHVFDEQQLRRAGIGSVDGTMPSPASRVTTDPVLICVTGLPSPRCVRRQTGFPDLLR